MIDSIKASPAGLGLVDQARRKKRWNKTAEVWCSQAFTSRATLSRFWAGQAIRSEMFIAICEAVGVDWQTVAEPHPANDPSHRQATDRTAPNSTNSSQEIGSYIEPHCDRPTCPIWEEIPEPAFFCGRTGELRTLENWIGSDRCRLVGLLGLGGIGKTALAAQYTQLHRDEFEFVIWRSLNPTLSPAQLLTELLQTLLGQELNQSNQSNQSEKPDSQVLIQYLRAHRCLIILDGVETLLPSQRTTDDRSQLANAEYQAEYIQLLTKLGEANHRSCVLFTSREYPHQLSRLEGEAFPVRCLHLGGLSPTAVQQLAQAKGNLIGAASEWAALTERYAGHPLALNLVVSTIRNLFGSSITAFLTLLDHSPFLIEEVQELLEAHLNRLGRIPQDLLSWLALNQKPVTLAELQEGLAYSISTSELMQAIATLQRCALIEITTASSCIHTGQQIVTLKYTTNLLIQQISWPFSRHFPTTTNLNDMNILNEQSDAPEEIAMFSIRQSSHSELNRESSLN
nr:MAG: NACHT domain-containing protein [Leptolyngbya sp. IPPAS B-1204]